MCCKIFCAILLRTSGKGWTLLKFHLVLPGFKTVKTIPHYYTKGVFRLLQLVCSSAAAYVHRRHKSLIQVMDVHMLGCWCWTQNILANQSCECQDTRVLRVAETVANFDPCSNQASTFYFNLIIHLTQNSQPTLPPAHQRCDGICVINSTFFPLLC